MATLIEEPTVEPDSAALMTDKKSDGRTIALGLLWGAIFGFLLQKGGVAKFHVLIGQLLLEDFTVLKVMLSAVIVGMIGIHIMHSKGLVELHLKPTKYAANILGGLLFGVGFALSAYCPGTGAAAIGQGNYDALLMVVGMLTGSYLFAEASGWVARKVDPIGNAGKVTLHDWVPASRSAVVVGSVIALSVLLVVIEILFVR